MADFNPYEAPGVSRSSDAPPFDPDEGRGVWRDGAALVMVKIARLPSRCVKCNGPATGRLRRTMSYHHPAIYLVVLANVIIYAIVASIVRKKAVIDIPLCDEHRASRRRAIQLSWLLGLAGLVIGLLPALNQDFEATIFCPAGLTLIVAGLIHGSIRSQVLRPIKIDDSHAWLGKVDPGYLADLPGLPSPYEGPKKRAYPQDDEL